MPYLISTGKVTQNNVPTPMYILARLNLDCAGHLGLQRIQGPQGHHRRLAAQGRLREEEGRGQGGEGRHDLPRRHARSVDPLLARRRRHRSRQGRLDHRRAAAADGGEHEGRQHGRLLRRRAVERAARQPGHRLHRLHDGRDLVQAPREGARHARRVGRQESEGRQGAADGRDGGPAVVRKDGKQAGDVGDRRQAPMVQRARPRHHRPGRRATSTTATAGSRRAPSST